MAWVQMLLFFIATPFVAFAGIPPIERAAVVFEKRELNKEYVISTGAYLKHTVVEKYVRPPTGRLSEEPCREIFTYLGIEDGKARILFVRLQMGEATSAPGLSTGMMADLLKRWADEGWGQVLEKKVFTIRMGKPRILSFRSLRFKLIDATPKTLRFSILAMPD